MHHPGDRVVGVPIRSEHMHQRVYASETCRRAKAFWTIIRHRNLEPSDAQIGPMLTAYVAAFLSQMTHAVAQSHSKSQWTYILQHRPCPFSNVAICPAFRLIFCLSGRHMTQDSRTWSDVIERQR